MQNLKLLHYFPLFSFTDILCKTVQTNSNNNNKTSGREKNQFSRFQISCPESFSFFWHVRNKKNLACKTHKWGTFISYVTAINIKFSLSWFIHWTMKKSTLMAWVFPIKVEVVNSKFNLKILFNFSSNNHKIYVEWLLFVMF